MVVRIKEHENLSPLVGVLREYGARRVFLFGSMARGDARPGSDVDLACEGLPLDGSLRPGVSYFCSRKEKLISWILARSRGRYAGA